MKSVPSGYRQVVPRSDPGEANNRAWREAIP